MAMHKLTVKIGFRWWVNPAVRIYGTLCWALNLDPNLDFVRRMAIHAFYSKGIK